MSTTTSRLLESLSDALTKSSYQVVTARNGKLAKDAFLLEAIDLVLSDINMPGSSVGGIELLEFVKKTRPVPVILMTGFATISQTKEANDAGTDAFLAKPFDREELLVAIEVFLGKPVAAVEVTNQDENYCRISISDFVSGKQIKYTIYVRLSATKYVKVAHLGEDLTAERIELFKRKGIQYLYLSKEDFHQYLQFSLGLANAVKSSRQISKDKKAHFMRHTTEVLMEQLFHSEIDQTDLADAQSVVQNSVGYLIESPECFDLLSTLNTHADFVYAHSMGVSLYSSLMAKKVGWNTPSTLYKLSFAGLLHDIGLKFVDRQILVKSKGALTLEETRSFEGHSVRGMEALARVPSVSSDVLQIVLMHHERDLGTGYPSGLIKNKIHPLARLTAVADEFCSLVISAPEAPAIPPKQALERLSALYASSLDPGFLVALMKIFNVEPPANLLRDKQKV